MALGYAGAYRNMMPPMGGYQAGPPLTFGGQGTQAAPFGPPQSLGPLSPAGLPPGVMGAGRMGGGGGGWAGALSGLTGWGDMSGMERAYLLASVGGGVADFFERRGEKEEERRRYEQQFEEDRKHRQMMGRNLNRVWGG